MKCCPECLSTEFRTDVRRAEISCSQCGLIVQSPPCADYIDAEPVLISKTTKKIWKHILFLYLKTQN